VAILLRRRGALGYGVGLSIAPVTGQKQMRKSMDKTTQTELEAAAFRRLVSHLQNRTDVQNIDMMNLAGFCRNCLSRWYREAAGDAGVDLSDADARKIVYGMEYADWKAQYQTEATPEQKAQYDKIHAHSK
jgi:hypothetical protein